MNDVPISVRRMIAGVRARIASIRGSVAQNEADELGYLESLERVAEQKKKLAADIAELQTMLNQHLKDAGLPLEED